MGIFTRVTACLGALLVAHACGVGSGPSRVEAAELARGPDGPVLRVAIVGHPGDPRVVVVREALAFWNRELARLQRTVRFDSGTVVADVRLPEDRLWAASRSQARPWAPNVNGGLRTSLRAVPGEAVVALSTTPDINSFGVPFEDRRRRGVVALRPMDRWPLTLPNVARNVAVHELGHLLGLPHNADARMLMCGRPAPCRPAAFTSTASRVFPLTRADESLLRERWP